MSPTLGRAAPPSIREFARSAVVNYGPAAAARSRIARVIDVAGSDVLLHDGSTVHVRRVSPDDRDAVERFLSDLSTESRRLRFFGAGVGVEEAARLAVSVDPPESDALVAFRGDGVVAHAFYGDLGGGFAEIAFAVADEMQGKGIATILLAHLAETAEEAGIGRFEATVLPENHRMIEVFRESGFAVSTRSLPGEIVVELPTAISAEAHERFEARERTAEVASLAHFLRPGSVAVVGASARPGTVGGETLRNCLRAGYTGDLYAVNRRGEEVAGVPGYASVTEIPGPVELAVLAVPPDAVVGAARDCAAHGVRALVVLTAGFAESGPEGVERQRELMETCRSAGMRVIGPNCLGIANTDAEVRLNATFAPSFPPAGRVGFLSQSGALALAMIDYAKTLGIGLSSFISNGNKADVSGNDVLQYWEEDPGTDIVLLYLESFGNPRKFARIARRVARRKPVLAVKAGRSAAGARGAGSHTGALISASDVTVDALFQQAGVVRADTLSELLDVAKLLSTQPVPAGPRVGIVTNAGGLGILCADACEAAGLEVPVLPEELQRQLTSSLPATASAANPIDMIATARGDHYRRTIAELAESGAVDSIVAIFIPPLVTSAEEAAEAIRDAAEAVAGRVPLLAVFTSDEGAPPALAESSVPTFAFPEEAARAVASASRYGTWLRRDHGAVPSFDDVRPDEAAAVIAEALSDGGGWLGMEHLARLLGCYGLPVPAWRIVEAPEETAAAAEEIGGPVALKAIAPGLLHKTDVGAVALDLEAGDVVHVARRMSSELAEGGSMPTGFLVQAMAEPGVEMLVGVVTDPLFGPVVACGGGGTSAEAMKDVAVRLTPLTDRDAREMIAALRSHALLSGWRGAPPADVASLEQVVLRLAALVEAHHEVVEVDLNPVVVAPHGSLVVDARVRVEPAQPRAPWPALGV
jgi:acetate---CoA ligase (ADP-forming)